MGRKRIIILVFSILLLVTGIGVLIFPYIAQWLYQRKAEGVIASYENEIEDMKKEEPFGDYFDDLYARMQAYNKAIYESGQRELTDPFAYQKASFDLTEFGFAKNVVGYIEIPVMNVKLPIYLGATEENMNKGAVHLTQTSLPIGGSNTNCVIAAHRGMSTAAMFRDIDDLNIGDELTITNFRESLVYRVVEIKIISPNNIEEILIQPGKDLVTLLTCHPYGYNYQRYTVYCERL